MSKKTLKEVHSEYSSLCMKAGHINYQIYINSKDLELIHEQLRGLNLEAAKISAEEEAAQLETAKAV